jgi:hypothetical protein
MRTNGNEMKLFISHSKYDDQIKGFFAQVLARKRIAPIFYEWENLGGKYDGEEIIKMLKTTDEEEYIPAVIVLLGKKLESPPEDSKQYTHNWVNFEVGIAAALKKPVWVFELFSETIKFPIPYVTDYVRYNLNDAEHVRILGDILEDQFITKKGQRKPVRTIKCPYEKCNATYNYWSESDKINCPVCRQAMERKKRKK